MKSHWFSVLSLLAVSAVVMTFAANVEFKKGETWTYEVKGPRAWSDENIYGDRVISVNAVNDKGYSVEDEWGSWDENVHDITVNQNGMITKLQIGTGFTLEYDKPIPFHYIDLLKVDEKKDFGRSSVEMDNFTLALSTVVKREKDEDVKVPAGEFKGSQHYVINNVLSFESNQGEMAKKMTRHIWVHQDVNGIVKESYEHQALSQEAGDKFFKGESLLKKHEVKFE